MLKGLAWAAWERGHHNHPMLGLSSPSFSDPVNKQLQGKQLICLIFYAELILIQNNKLWILYVHLNWVKTLNGRAGLTLHKKFHGSHVGINSVFNLNCSYCCEPRISKCYIFCSKFFLISVENFILFSRKTYFNHHNLIKCRNTPQKGKISSGLHGPAGKWAGWYFYCEVMCTPTAQIFFIKYQIIMKVIAGKICCITSCNQWDKFQHKVKKGWEFSVSPQGWFSALFQMEGSRWKRVHSNNKENLWKLRINTTI